MLDEALTKHPEAEFVQLQINYADWENDNVQSRKCYEVALKHNKPIVIMEPVKGGSLAAMVPEVQDMMKAENPDLSIPSWAIRYCAGLDNIIAVLSGMSTQAQLDDNVSYMEHFEPLSEKEHAVLDRAVQVLKSIPTVPCTACRYCVDDCPMHINIPEIFKALNGYKQFGCLEGTDKPSTTWASTQTRQRTAQVRRMPAAPCEAHCPQHISIIEELERRPRHGE